MNFLLVKEESAGCKKSFSNFSCTGTSGRRKIREIEEVMVILRRGDSYEMKQEHRAIATGNASGVMTYGCTLGGNPGRRAPQS